MVVNCLKKQYKFCIILFRRFKIIWKKKAELDSLSQSKKEFSKDIGMQFGTDKCATIAIKANKIPGDNGISSMMQI